MHKFHQFEDLYTRTIGFQFFLNLTVHIKIVLVVFDLDNLKISISFLDSFKCGNVKL